MEMVKMETISSMQQPTGVSVDPPSGSKKFRVQLDVEANDFALINQLVEELDLGTRAELFRSGLRALRWMIGKKKEGSTIVAITRDKRIMEPEFDFLMHIHPVDGPLEQAPKPKPPASTVDSIAQDAIGNHG
jgi:hypothetical protein